MMNGCPSWMATCTLIKPTTCVHTDTHACSCSKQHTAQQLPRHLMCPACCYTLHIQATHAGQVLVYPFTLTSTQTSKFKVCPHLELLCDGLDPDPDLVLNVLGDGLGWDDAC